LANKCVFFQHLLDEAICIFANKRLNAKRTSVFLLKPMFDATGAEKLLALLALLRCPYYVSANSTNEVIVHRLGGAPIRIDS
jgi:hypothetical protein